MTWSFVKDFQSTITTQCEEGCVKKGWWIKLLHSFEQDITAVIYHWKTEIKNTTTSFSLRTSKRFAIVQRIRTSKLYSYAIKTQSAVSYATVIFYVFLQSNSTVLWRKSGNKSSLIQVLVGLPVRLSKNLLVSADHITLPRDGVRSLTEPLVIIWLEDTFKVTCMRYNFKLASW